MAFGGKSVGEISESMHDVPIYQLKGEGLLLGSGNSERKYLWEQTASEVRVLIPLIDGIKARDIMVESKRKSLKVQIKSTGDTWLDGELIYRVVPKDTLWTIEDGNLCIDLTKENGDQRWNTLFIETLAEDLDKIKDPVERHIAKTQAGKLK